MAVIQFQQRDVNNPDPPGIVTMCSGITVDANAVGRKAEVGAAPGIIFYNLLVTKGTHRVYITHYLPLNNILYLYNTFIDPSPCTYRLNITTGHRTVYWTGIWYCLVDSQHNSKKTIAGSSVFSTRLNVVQVYSRIDNIVGGPNQFWDDYIYIVIRLQNQDRDNNAIIQVTFDQLIDIEMNNEPPPNIVPTVHKQQKQDKKLEVIGYDG